MHGEFQIDEFGGLDSSSNGLHQFPEKLLELSPEDKDSVQYLDLSYNHFTEIPKKLPNLIKLQICCYVETRSKKPLITLTI